MGKLRRNENRKSVREKNGTVDNRYQDKSERTDISLESIPKYRHET